MDVTLFSPKNCIINFSPLTLTRPLAEIRVGILTLKEKWEKYLNTKITNYICPEPLSFSYPYEKTGTETLFINSAVLPNTKLAEKINQLKSGEKLVYKKQIIAAKCIDIEKDTLKAISLKEEAVFLESLLDVLTYQIQELQSDFSLITKNRKSKSLKDIKSSAYGGNYFIEEGIKDKSAIINTEYGPVYIGKNVTLSEFSVIQGPCAILDNSTILPQTHLRAGTTIGVNCAVGGEVKGSILSDYSNKAHYGYLGDSIIGSFCNLGAGTTCSNLKNNFGEISIPLFEEEIALPSGKQKLGIIMGDYNCTAIQSSFFSGTYIGIANNIYNHNPKVKRIENYSWGDNEVYQLSKLSEFINNFMKTKKLTPETGQLKLLEYWWNKSFLSAE